MNKILKKTISWILYIALLIALIYGIPQLLSYFLKSEYPMAAITSGSMWPALEKGDLVLIKGVRDKSEIEVGDIVVYKNPQGFTIHRIVKINEDSLITKGDANNSFDAPIKYEEIVGKALELNQKPIKIPFLGNISILINQHLLD